MLYDGWEQLKRSGEVGEREGEGRVEGRTAWEARERGKAVQSEYLVYVNKA